MALADAVEAQGSSSRAPKHGFEQPTEKDRLRRELPENISVVIFAQQMAVKAGVVIKELMKLGVMATINQMIDQDTATLVVEELGHRIRLVSDDEARGTARRDTGRAGGHAGASRAGCHCDGPR